MNHPSFIRDDEKGTAKDEGDKLGWKTDKEDEEEKKSGKKTELRKRR